MGKEINTLQERLDARADAKLRKEIDDATGDLNRLGAHYVEVELDGKSAHFSVVIHKVKEALFERNKELYRRAETEAFMNRIEGATEAWMKKEAF